MQRVPADPSQGLAVNLGLPEAFGEHLIGSSDPLPLRPTMPS